MALSLHDRSAKPEVIIPLNEWKGPLLSLNIIDVEVLQPLDPGKLVQSF